MRSLAGSMESNMVATAKPSQNEVKSHEILLGNNLNQHGTVSISYNSQKFSTLGRTSGSGHNTANMSSDCDTSKLTRYIAMSELKICFHSTVEFTRIEMMTRTHDK